MPWTPPYFRTLGVLKPTLALLVTFSLWARHSGPAECGTEPGFQAAERFLHKQSRLRRFTESGALSAVNNQDIGGIAIIDDADGVVSRRNPFSIGQQTLRFTPLGNGGYRLETPADAPHAQATAATPLTGLGDDDSRNLALPFPFPFFGATYTSVFVNSDGNLTFAAGDSASSDRSVARFNAGPPRIAPLFSDLDPSRPGGSVTMHSDDTHAIFSWESVPVYTDFGVGARQTFQVRLFADGAIEFAYSSIAISGSTAVVGIAPGRLSAATELLTLIGSAGHETSNGVAEFFSDIDQLDVAAAAQKFYTTHEDSYDYLFFFNALHLYINNGSIVAFEDTVRNSVQGYGIGALDDGLIFGSPRRLQAVMNMGPVEQYPLDPYALMPARAGTGDTGMSVLGHEAGHRFLAWTSVRDESGNPVMWGRSNAHWSFNFNSEASVDEGNRIRDNGTSVKPRFTTVATAEGYSPLDQYLFGFRGPEEVARVFAVLNGDGPANASAPHAGTSFNGRRFDVSIDDVIAVTGPRVPDAGLAQRNYRFGFVLVQSANDPLPSELLASVARYRSQWTSYWKLITGGRSTAEVEQARAVSVSFWPQAEIQLGAILDATVSIASAVVHDLVFAVESPDGIVAAPGPVVIKAGETSARVALRGAKSGVETVTLRPEDGAFEVVQTRVRVVGQ